MMPAPIYPGNIATDANLKVAANVVQTTLRVSVGATDTILFVQSIAGFVANGLVSIDNEIIAISSVTAGQIALNVSARGFDGTSAASHAAGAKVSMLIVAWHHNALRAEIEAIETALGPNLSKVIAASPIVVSNTLQFTPQSPGGSLVVGANQITLSPVPAGVNGTDANHYLYVSGGTGTPEAALIVGGSGVAGSASGTIIIQCANTHSGAWTIQTATSGIQEAIISVGPVTSSFITTGTGGGVIFIPVGMHDVYAPITLTSNVTLWGANSRSAIVRSNGTTIIRTLGSALTGCAGCGIQDLAFDLNLMPNITGLDLYGCMSGTFRNLYFTRGNQQPSIGIYLHGSPKTGGTWGPDYCCDCYFEHIHMEEGPQRCLVLMRATLCTFQTCRFSCDTGPVVDLVAATDTNYFYDIDISSGNANQGIYFNSSNTPADADFGVGAFHFMNVTFEGANPHSAILFGITDGNEIINLYGTWTTPITFVGGSSTNCSVTNISGFGSTKKVSAWSSDGLTIGILQNPSFINFNRSTLNLTNGANQNINPGNGTWCVATGPTAAFSIGGFQNGQPGRLLYLLNETLQTMTILNQNAGSAAANQIITLGGADIPLRAGARSFAQFIYDDVLQGWILMGTN